MECDIIWMVINVNFISFLVTFLSGLSFCIGYLITKLFENKKKLIIFSIGFAFSILIGLALFDLLPECFELFNKWYIVPMYVLVGVFILKAFDLLLPNHEHTDNSKHIEHISLISCIAIILHNIIESTAIYTTGVKDIRMGVLMAIGVSCHNIPLGIQITSLTKSNKKSMIMISLLALSSVVGILVFQILNIQLTDNIAGALISITLGMLMYIVFFELFCEVKKYIKTKEMFYGLFFGIAVIVLSLLI